MHMTHKGLEKFWGTLSQYLAISKTKECHANGKNSIRIVFDDGKESIFTYQSQTDWSIETVESYIRRINPVFIGIDTANGPDFTGYPTI